MLRFLTLYLTLYKSADNDTQQINDARKPLQLRTSSSMTKHDKTQIVEFKSRFQHQHKPPRKHGVSGGFFCLLV